MNHIEMKILAVTILASTLFVSGCSQDENAPKPKVMDKEALAFGYKGSDAVLDTNMTYLVAASSKTNWVPMRVLSLFEQYEFTTNELALIEAAGTLTPSKTCERIPEGYSVDSAEPWFTTYVKPAESFGLKGVVGTIVHFDDTRNLWETGDSYFSTYWKTEEEAMDASAKIRNEVSAKFAPKKIYNLYNGWIAEYVRLRVICVVGQKPDGTIACMLDFGDKNNEGCGEWEPVEDQQERLDYHVHAREMKAWQLKVKELYAKNSEFIKAAMETKGLSGFPDAQEQSAGELKSYVLYGYGSGTETAEDANAAMTSAWAAKCEEIAKALGVAFAENVSRQEAPEQGVLWSGHFKGDLYAGQLEMFMPYPRAIGESAAEATPPDVPKADPSQWRVTYVEVLQPEIVIPPTPVLKRGK